MIKVLSYLFCNFNHKDNMFSKKFKLNLDFVVFPKILLGEVKKFASCKKFFHLAFWNHLNFMCHLNFLVEIIVLYSKWVFFPSFNLL